MATKPKAAPAKKTGKAVAKVAPKATTNGLAAASLAARAEGKRLRCAPADRKASLDATILQMVGSKGGIASVTLERVAAAAGCSSGLAGRYYGGAAKMRVAAVNALAKAGDTPALRKVFADGFDIKAEGLKLPKGFAAAVRKGA